MKLIKTIKVNIIEELEDEIKVVEKEITIRKMPVKRFAQLMMGIEGLPKKLQGQIGLDDLDNVEGLLVKVPSLLAQSQDEIFNLISVASGVEKEVIEELGSDDFMDVVLTIYELNNIKAIVDKLKNAGKVLLNK